MCRKVNFVIGATLLLLCWTMRLVACSFDCYEESSWCKMSTTTGMSWYWPEAEYHWHDYGIGGGVKTNSGWDQAFRMCLDCLGNCNTTWDGSSWESGGLDSCGDPVLSPNPWHFCEEQGEG
jgi:hypothetical protein